MPTIAGAITFNARAPMTGDWDVREPGVGMRQRGDCVWTGNVMGEPATHADAGLVLTWDGRLDNANDLLLRLGTDRRCDAEIALAAFDR